MEQIRTEAVRVDHHPARLRPGALTGGFEPVGSAAASRPVGISPWRGDERALIFRRGRSAMTSGAAGANRWVLRFERRTAPYIEPLMGWTGGDEPLAQIELTFHSCEEAVRYAEREGLSYRVEGEALAATAEQRRHAIRQEEKVHLFATAAALAWRDPRYGTATLGRRPDFDRALMNPASVYAAPSEVLYDPSLTTEDKREILRRWAWDAWLLEVAADEAMAGGEPSRFDEVKAALASLDRTKRTTLVVAQNASVDARQRISAVRPTATSSRSIVAAFGETDREAPEGAKATTSLDEGGR